MSDFIPSGSTAYDTFFKNLIQYVTLQCTGASPRWTHIPQDARDALADQYGAWYTAYSVTRKPCTSPQRAEARRLLKSTRKALRNFINIYLRYHPSVTPEDKENMGIPVPSGEHTPINPPKTAPTFIIVQLGPGTLGIIYQDGERRKGSKPKNVRGARIYYGVFGEPATDQRKLPASVWATRCPHIIRFREADRGKRAFFALKWEISKENGEGPWSEIQSEIIP
ncbi:MAG: hypothetical protein LBK74_04545 [Treponema sp.]|jgi:hypothetical protein|nr:hypothetical protein [Treponema sp.]